ncbi:MAG: membrane protein insertion efficiency factor YidD [Proteobacteria bacterium]|jgi:putative membrane protein insertion efficiency factor|nr:membrane protein insertion efficiency factor YidD [Pseudomonadota bacterium]
MMKKILVYLIKGYQLLISPMLGTRCRFHPSCSAYAVESIEKNGALLGVLQTSKRLSKCHPFHAGGFDPVEKI